MLARGRYAIFLLGILCVVWQGCSPRALHEAQQVVAEADSLWKAGQAYDDSTQLAQAYRRLGSWQWLYADAYAHSCYHYSKLLRTHDDPVSAMQAFINATHSRTHDYHILGRVYNNMGDMCHRAEEFELSYDMFERSAEMYLCNSDMILYYYCLNDMAFEKAILTDTLAAFSLLADINSNCADNDVLTKTLETKAELYLRIQQYDSALFYASELCAKSNYYPIAKLIQAQIYSYQGMKDSAVYYAEQVLCLSSDMSDIHNALYILTNDDESKDKEAIRATAADRADLQQILRQKQGRLSQAVQLLEQDLNRKPDRRWIYAVIGTLIVIGSIIVLYVYRKRKQHALLSQKIEHLEVSYSDMQANKTNQIEQTCAILRTSASLQSDLSWKDFEKMCVFVNEHFNLLANKLRQTGVLNETEIRLCVLVLIGLSRSEIADTLPYALNSVGKLKDHTAKSLGTTGKNLHVFLLQMAIEV